MANRLVVNARRTFLAASCLLGAAMGLVPTPASAFTWSFDNDGRPLPLNNEQAIEELFALFNSGTPAYFEDLGLRPTIPDGESPLQYRESMFLPEDAGFFIGDGGVVVADLDVSLKLRHPRIQDLSVYLVAFNGISPITVALLERNGCAANDYTVDTTFNQDISLYLDDQAQAAIDFACDRTIPTLSGRHKPTTRRRDIDYLVGLSSFNGFAIGEYAWLVVIRDYGDTGSKGALLEFSLHFNGNTESDTTPREETSTASPIQSGNNIVTETDYVLNAYHLLGLEHLDNRVFSGQSDDLSRLGGNYVSARRSSSTEFARLDSAPASSSGDGIISVADFVQSNRYAASLDALKKTSVGPLSRDDRMLFARLLDGPVLVRGEDVLTTVSVLMRSKQAETEVGFGLTYDNSLLEYVGIERGDCVPENAIFQVNRALDLEEGLIGLRVGVDPDETFVCDRTPNDPLLATGSITAPVAIPSVVANDTATRPLAKNGVIRITNNPVTFTSFLPRVVVNVDLETSDAERIVRDYYVRLDFDPNKLRIRSVGPGAFGVTPTFSSFPFSADDDEVAERLAGIRDFYASNPASTFTSGRLFTVEFEVIPGGGFGAGGYSPSLDYPSVSLLPSNVAPINPVSDSAVVNSLHLYELIDDATQEISSSPRVSIEYLRTTLDICQGPSEEAPDTPASTIFVGIRVSNNVLTVTNYLVELGYNADILRPRQPYTGLSGAGGAGEGYSFVNGPDSVIGLFGTGPISTFMNGRMLEIPFDIIAAPTGDYQVTLNSFDAPLLDQTFPVTTSTLTFDCDTDTVTPSLQAPVGDVIVGADAKGAPESTPSFGEIRTEVLSVRQEGARVLTRVGVYASNLANNNPITSYNFVLTFNDSVLALLPATGADGGAGFGAPPTFTLLDTTGPLGGLPNLPTSNYVSYKVRGASATSTLRSGLLATMEFEVVATNPTPVALHINAVPPRNENVEVARVYFRAREGEGTVATELKFGPNPFFDGLAVRNPLGAPIYTSFIDAGVTVIDNALPRPTVRLVDTVLNENSVGNLQIALDSVGVETAAGFTLKFNPAEITLLEVTPGRDVPADAFFFTNPNANDVSGANASGMLRMLVALQVGNAEGSRTFQSGTRILANLKVRTSLRPSNVPTTEAFSSLVEFLPLSDTREVVDANAIPLETRFPVGTVNFASSSCVYTLSSDGGNFPTLGARGEFTVTATSGCPWVPTTAANWIKIDNEGVVNFSSQGRVSFQVLPNPGGPRQALIEVGGKQYVVSQAGCSFRLAPAQFSLSGEGGTGSFEVFTDETCAWQVNSADSWIVITSSRFNTGTRRISFRVDPNVGAPRTGTIVLNNGGAGLTFTVSQEICDFSVNPAASLVFEPSGGEGSFDLLTQGFCQWTVRSKPTWVTILTANSGTGPAMVQFAVAQNLGSDNRSGIIEIADQRYTVSQAGNAICTYTLSSDRGIYPASGGTGSFGVTTLASCPWEVAVDQPWVTITSEDTGFGSTTISFRVGLNDSVTRFANITVNGQQFVIQQFGSNQFAFDFVGNAEGWRAASISPSTISGAYDASEVTVPGGALKRGRLSLTATSNQNTFGFWESPKLRLDTAATATSLYLTEFEVRSNLADPAVAPTFRGRVSAANFEQTNEIWAFSSGNGNYSPSVAGTRYSQYMTLPANTTEFLVFFDLISYIAEDAANATLSLERVSIQQVSLAPASEVQEGFFALTNNQAGFERVPSSGQLPGFVAPRFETTSRGVAIGAQDNLNTPGQHIFGFYTKTTNITTQADRLYRATFQVSARSTRGQEVIKSKVPPFRLRLNSSSFRAANVVHLDSRDENSPMPTLSTPVTYDVYMLGTPQTTNDKLILNFDYILPAGSLDDPAIQVVLESVRVRSYSVPVSQ